MSDFDIVIVGGGLIGLALLDKLEKSGKKVILLDDSEKQRQPKARPLVLTSSSANFLGYKEGIPLDRVKVTAYSQPGLLNFSAFDYGVSEFAHVVDAVKLQSNLLARNEQLIKKGITVVDVQQTSTGAILVLSNGEKISTKLLFAADGADSTISKCVGANKILGSSIDVKVIPNVQLMESVPAQLRFLSGGTIAFLPTSNARGTIVATGQAIDADMFELWRRHLPILDLPNFEIRYSQSCFYLERLKYGSVVFLGNAAHSLPPVGAQGFNLGCQGLRYLATLNFNGYEKDFYEKVYKTFRACDFLASGRVQSITFFGMHFINMLGFLKRDLVSFVL